MQIPHDRRKPQTIFTKREILDIVNDSRNNPHTGGLHHPAPPQTDRLAHGRNLNFVIDGRVLEYKFISRNILRYKHGDEWRETYYEGFEPAEDILFFFHLHDLKMPPAKMSAFCIDMKNGYVTLNSAQIGNSDYTPRDTSNTISFGRIQNYASPDPPHHFTDDFVGKVAAWHVGDFWLTHHYINPKFFLNEIMGLAPDTLFLTVAEPAQYVKLRDNVYIFTWREMAGPGIMGMDVMDWKTMTSVGMFFGINEDDRFECYSFARTGGKWLDIEDRKKVFSEGLRSVLGEFFE